jgi:hypothetical protein
MLLWNFSQMIHDGSPLISNDYNHMKSRALSVGYTTERKEKMAI